MRRQNGCFLYDTLDYAQANLSDLEDFLNQPQIPGPIELPALTKIIIPHQIVGDVLQRLDITGFSATHLYENYEGAAIDVRDDYNFDRKSGKVWDKRPPLMTEDEP
jgi:hypothetical protein